MDGFKAFKYYTALKLHFSQPKFNVFVNRGHVKGSYEKFLSRNDRMIFERLAKQFNDKDFIQYVASNFMYGHADMIYDNTDAMANYKEYLRRKQSITKVFADDIQVILDTGAQYEFSGNKIPDVLQLLMGKRITLETVVILNEMDHFVDHLKQSTVALLLGDDLLRIEKAKGFVKYVPEKIVPIYKEFMNEWPNQKAVRTL